MNGSLGKAGYDGRGWNKREMETRVRDGMASNGDRSGIGTGIGQALEREREPETGTGTRWGKIEQMGTGTGDRKRGWGRSNCVTLNETKKQKQKMNALDEMCREKP